MMTPEQLLLTAIAAVTGALVFVAKTLWGESLDCKRDRIALRMEIENVKTKAGESSGKLSVLERCAAPGCPFRPGTPLIVSPSK